MILEANEIIRITDYLYGFTTKGRKIGSGIDTNSFLFKCENNTLTIMSTDLTNICVKTIKFEHDDFEVSIDASQLKKTLSNYKNEEINIKFTKTAMNIKKGRSTVKIKTSKNIDFPIIPEKTKQLGHINFNDFKTIIKSCFFAIDINPKQSGGPLESVFFGESYICATDRYKVCYIENTPLFESSFCIHNSFLKSFIKNDYFDDCCIYESDGFIVFEFDDTEIYLRKTTIKYPNISKMVKIKGKYRYIINKDSIKKSINLASSFSDDNYADICFKFGGGKLEVSSENQNGNYKDIIDIESELDDLFEIRFQTQFLKDVVNEINSESIELFCETSKSPVVMKNKVGEFDQTIMILPTA